MDKKIAQKSPFVMELEPGTYAWCACGHSSKQPYCDGSHKGSEFSPNIEQITEKKWWLGVDVKTATTVRFATAHTRIYRELVSDLELNLQTV